ncbi:MAG: XRE family transcriptional regulator [Acidobacteria bacterium]|nr:MAG: XRE family transcriptional regulator [Acidobacteriota bacterium]PIE89849.1 MAG: XRE family transcriptional regulator [Acidobacteriota bacterium]
MKPVTGDHLKLVFGLKLKQVRQDRGLSLKQVAGKTGLSVSYLSEIESGKKYPKPEKLIGLANALQVPFDDLVSMKMGKTLNPLMELLDSSLVREFPFHMFGINIRSLVDLATVSPEKTGALVRTLTEFIRTYDLKLEDFLFAALRSYQKVNGNYFEELEQEAADFGKEHGIVRASLQEKCEIFQKAVESANTVIDSENLTNYPDLMDLRSVYVNSKPARLLLNPELRVSQKAFILGREIGYQRLELKQRPKTSSLMKATRFDRVLDNYKASYFSGAMIIPERVLVADLKTWFNHKKWNQKHLRGLLSCYGVTPEMFLYRLSQVLPRHFGLKDIYYLRFNHSKDGKYYRLIKELNMSQLAMPSGINLYEHYCRRWLSIRQLEEAVSGKGASDEPVIEAQRSHFIDQDLTILNISILRPLYLKPDSFSSMTLGIVLTEKVSQTIHFAFDSSIPDVDVNETCERCFMSKDACGQRVAPPFVFNESERLKTRENSLKCLLRDFGEV